MDNSHPQVGLDDEWLQRQVNGSNVSPLPQVGLDPLAFTFASFNQPFKISALLFGAWMRILERVPGAQLWIVALNEGASAETVSSL